MSLAFLAGCVVWGLIAGSFVLLRWWWRRPAAALEDSFLRSVPVVLATVALCTLPMALCPVWNGEIPGHRDQYERLAEALLEGHLDVDYGDTDPGLLEMENPYDPAARKELNVSFHWDHAFYHGKYYVYFGVVPVLLLFLPFRAITGVSLTTFHATQVFTALFILGLFALFHRLAKRFFPELPQTLYLLLGAACSLMSVWYITAAPALYCTAISAGLCMEVWSLYCFVRGVWCTQEENAALRWAALGALFGALAFGCRPPIAVANLLVLPMLVRFLRSRPMRPALAGKLALAALPYVAVAILLMLYNYARFDNPFEFGQSYQLTLADQSQYGHILEQWSWSREWDGLIYYFLALPRIRDSLRDTLISLLKSGLFPCFPLLLYSAAALRERGTRKLLREQGMMGFTVMLAVSAVVIALLNTLASPFPQPRYRTDLCWLLCVMVFVCIGFLHRGREPAARGRLYRWAGVLALLAVWVSILLFFVPYDSNYTAYVPDAFARFVRVLSLGFVNPG